MYRLPLCFGLTGLALGLMGPIGVWAQRPALKIHPASRFWIHGTTTVNQFTCVAHQVRGGGRLPRRRDLQTQDTLQVRLRVAVRSFDCGNERMSEDLKETLKAEKHPHITFALIHATIGALADTAGRWTTVHAIGPLTVAGTKRLVRLQGTGRALGNGRYQLRGCTTLKMTRFGIDPPSKALGLIQVDNQIEVKFDLMGYVPTAGPTPSFAALSHNDLPTCK